MSNLYREQLILPFEKNNLNKHLKFSRYILGVCSTLLFLIGILFTIFMPPLLIFYPLFVYLIFLNFRNTNRMLDQFDLIQICIWFIVFLPVDYFIIINFIFILFILFKFFKKQICKIRTKNKKDFFMYK